MDTNTSFIGQMSDFISRQILPKNYYNRRHAILKIVDDITPSWRTQKNEE